MKKLIVSLLFFIAVGFMSIRVVYSKAGIENDKIASLIRRLSNNNVVRMSYGLTTVGREAAELLAKMGKRSINPLINVLKNKNPKVRMRAVYALGKIKDSKALNPIITALKDKNPNVRIKAMRALVNMKSDETIEEILNILKDKDLNVRMKALEILRSHQTNNGIESEKNSIGIKLSLKLMVWRIWWERNKDNFINNCKDINIKFLKGFWWSYKDKVCSEPYCYYVDKGYKATSKLSVDVSSSGSFVSNISLSHDNNNVLAFYILDKTGKKVLAGPILPDDTYYFQHGEHRNKLIVNVVLKTSGVYYTYKLCVVTDSNIMCCN